MKRISFFVVTIIMISMLAIICGACGVLKTEPKESETTAMLTEKQKWNKMWDLWVAGDADSPYAKLMTYQAEVNNGGHDQYFLNVSNGGDLEEEIAVLKGILPETHKANLEKAYKAYLALEENENNEEAASSLEQCDDTFYENEEEINHILKEYAAKIEQ